MFSLNPEVVLSVRRLPDSAPTYRKDDCEQRLSLRLDQSVDQQILPEDEPDFYLPAR